MTKIAFVGDVHLKENTPRSRKDCYYESILNKLEQVLNDNDCIIFLGDLFDKPVITTFVLNKLIDIFNKYNKNVYTIIGNHDIFNMNFNTLSKTSLGILINTNIVKLIEEPLIIGNICIQNIPMIKNMELPLPKEDYINIAVGHLFYESHLDPKYSITKDMIKNSSLDYILLGHDHMRYDNVQIKDTVIKRSGSIGRNTAEGHNLFRIPGYYQYCTKSISFTYITLNTKTGNEIYFEEVFENKNKKEISLSFVDGLEDILKQFKKTNTCKNSIKDILNSMKIPKVCYNYIKNLYDRNNEVMY